MRQPCLLTPYARLLFFVNGIREHAKALAGVWHVKGGRPWTVVAWVSTR